MEATTNSFLMEQKKVNRKFGPNCPSMERKGNGITENNNKTKQNQKIFILEKRVAPKPKDIFQKHLIVMQLLNNTILEKNKQKKKITGIDEIKIRTATTLLKQIMKYIWLKVFNLKERLVIFIEYIVEKKRN